jgi:hypothetical protein
MRRLAQRAAVGLELARVLAVLPGVEWGRRRLGPKPLLQRLRRRGRGCRERDPAARRRLRSAIAWLDARFPDQGNCYRRALLEVALDRGAAGEPFRMGFRLGEGALSGHAWLADRAGASESYDAELVL